MMRSVSSHTHLRRSSSRPLSWTSFNLTSIHGRCRRYQVSATTDAPSNLGQLSKFAGVGQLSPAEAQAMLTRVDPSSFQDQDIVLDPGAIFASVVLLLLLLAFTFNRILGLDELLIKAARTAKARREQEEQDAMRKRLVQMLDGGADGASGGSGANGVKPPPRNGPPNLK